MEFFRDPNIQFMKYRKIFVVVSLVLALAGISEVFLKRSLNLGVDFAGGTQLTLKFREQPEMNELRRLIEAAGIPDAVIQSYGDEGDNEVMIKTPTLAAPKADAAASQAADADSDAEGEEAGEGARALVVEALAGRYGSAEFDLNLTGTRTLADKLLELDPDRLRAQDRLLAAEHYETVAAAITQVRRRDGYIGSWEELEGLPGVSDEVRAALQQNAALGGYAIQGVENVGPQIGAELRKKGILAVISSLIGILIYIWFRFELRFGIGALVAVTHDVLIVLGLFALGGFEFNLTTVAGFLTLVGYSVNDTVVVFDRVRENLRRTRREPLEETMNRSINQTLSRTVLTSGTTLLVVGCLLFLGGDVLRGFAFILTVGIVIGTYSSIYVASPFALMWENLFGREARLRRSAAAA